MYEVDLQGKTGIVFGVANHRSIAWSVAEILAQAGAKLAFTYQNDRLSSGVAKLAATVGDGPVLPCDVSDEEQIERAVSAAGEHFGGKLDIIIHSVAFANREDLEQEFSRTSREGFRVALEISAYSLLPIVRHALPFMHDGGSIVTMTFQAAQRVFPNYNVMGTAKAALEHEVRQLAAEVGPSNIRVNAISAGPLDTLAARGIHGFVDMKHVAAERSPLRRNITHDEVAKTALYLCSNLSSGVTGAIIPVDSGYHIVGL